MFGPNRLELLAPAAAKWAVVAEEEDVADETATRSHEGHIVRVVGGFICM